MPSVETIRQTRVPAGAIEKPAGASNSVFDVAKPPKRSYTPLDAASVEIRKNVPLPPVTTGRGAESGARARCSSA